MYDKLKEIVIEFILNNKLTCFFAALSLVAISFSISFIYLNKCPKCIKCKSDILVKTQKEKVKTIKVDVKGEVKAPGVYTLKEGLSVIDAINASGGLNDNATTKNINLSKRLEDEMVIYVSNKSELDNEESKDAQTKYSINENSVNYENSLDESKPKVNGKININTASESDLTLLSGIGPSKAKKIIEYRNSHGSFKSLEEIKNVSGIGDKAFEKIKDYITI